MKRTELVAVWIVEVSQIPLTTKPWRIFDRHSTIRDTSLVPRGGLLRACHRQTHHASIGGSGWSLPYPIVRVATVCAGDSRRYRQLPPISSDR